MVPASSCENGGVNEEKGGAALNSVSRQILAAHIRDNYLKGLALLAAATLLITLVFAQSSPVVSSVDPSSGKVSDEITISGQSLGKGSVSSVFLSDDKSDYKATIVSQADDKIVMKVPSVKPGDYNVSIQVADKIMIMPVRFTVGE
jgi:hypothetical protein